MMTSSVDAQCFERAAAAAAMYVCDHVTVTFAPPPDICAPEITIADICPLVSVSVWVILFRVTVGVINVRVRVEVIKARLRLGIRIGVRYGGRCPRL